ncbi:MAG TPA: aminotransferase class V-fold PLP-dependent enzyme [Candidatus Marinimicrobia bacterium]|nr:aminotransferase class V-fold PLP-dependent enzyme [Candidatus Neomarinimicrobiota bacterium]
MPLLFEAGTHNMPGIISLYEGLKYILDKGIDSLRHIKESVILELRHSLCQNDAFIGYPGTNIDKNGTILSINIKGLEPDDLTGK